MTPLGAGGERTMYDAIVVGARCAGAPTAMLLARRGWRVLLVDRATFPSDTLSAHYIHHTGVARLRRWGLLGPVAASNCPPIYRFHTDLGGELRFTVDYRKGEMEFGRGAIPIPAPAEGDGAVYCPRRRILDAILLDAAAASGVEVREAFTVAALITDGEQVSGIRGKARSSGEVTERAPIVIGADGRHSLVARTVSAPEYDLRPPYTCAYHSYWSGLDVDGLEFYARPGRCINVTPTNDGRVVIGIGWPNREFHALRQDLDGHFAATVALAPRLADRLTSAVREEKFVGTADLPGFFRRPYGPGWALVGDAGYHRDPIVGQGISDAFRDAELLADAVHEGLAGIRPMADALAGYERLRNDAARPMYELACRLAALEPPSPSMIPLLAGFAPQFAREGSARQAVAS